MFTTKLLRLYTNTINRKISALYIKGDKASETFSVLTPHIDFEERLKNQQELVDNLRLRQIDINLDDVTRIWNFYKHMESKKDDLEESKLSISRTITNLGKKGDKYADKINTLKAHGKMVKEDLRVLNESFRDVEEKAVIQALNLPNILHPLTPETEIKVIHSFKDKPIEPKTIKKGMVEYSNPHNYYLLGAAAHFELNCTQYLQDKLRNKYLQFSNSDFARSVIVDGTGLDFSGAESVFTINEAVKHDHSRLHLVGGASLPSFMAYYCKHTVFQTQLPLRYFAIGRKYQPRPMKTGEQSLRNVAQETAVQLFVATKDDANEMTAEFERTLADVIDIYETFNYPFRVCFVPAKELERWESLRASVQMFSPVLGDYAEVGFVSLCGNYVSKRLLFNYGKGANVNYPGVISGTVLSVPKLLACVLDMDETLSPSVFQTCI